MTTSSASPRTELTPNHHAHYPGFAGVSGLIAALSFSIGRDSDADLAARLTGLGPGDHVIDVGCGSGAAVRRAALSATSVVGVDPAPVMLRVARLLTRHRKSSEVHYIEGAAEGLPLPDDSATVAWSLAAVHHWRDLDAGLEEARRVLGRSGRLLAIERCVEPGASGHASHGWTDDQARTFAERCRDARLRRHRDRSPPVQPSPRHFRPHAHHPGECLTAPVARRSYVSSGGRIVAELDSISTHRRSYSWTVQADTSTSTSSRAPHHDHSTHRPPARTNDSPWKNVSGE